MRSYKIELDFSSGIVELSDDSGNSFCLSMAAIQYMSLREEVCGIHLVNGGELALDVDIYKDLKEAWRKWLVGGPYDHSIEETFE